MNHSRDSIHAEMIGNKFHKWTVKSYSHQATTGNYMYSCVCECGTESPVRGTYLRTGSSKQCVRCSSRIKGRKGLYARNAGKDLYFVRCGEFIKIGVSSDVPKRLKALKSSNPHPLELMYHGVGEGVHEEQWHLLYQDMHLHGEWFRVSASK